jgi:hypothetical protein
MLPCSLNEEVIMAAEAGEKAPENRASLEGYVREGPAVLERVL